MGNPRSPKKTQQGVVCKTVGRRRGAKLAKGFDDLRSLIPCYPPEKSLTKIETLRLAILYIKDLSDIVDTSSMTASDDISLSKSMSSICSSVSSECSKSTCSTPGVDRESVDNDSVTGVTVRSISRSSSPGSPPKTDALSNTRHVQALPNAFFAGGSPSFNAGNLSGKGVLASPYYRSLHPTFTAFAGGQANIQPYGMQQAVVEDEALSAHQFLSFLQHQALANSHFGAEPSPVPISPLPLPFSTFEYTGPCGVFA